jgi:hypothetical protein
MDPTPIRAGDPHPNPGFRWGPNFGIFFDLSSVCR